MRDLDPVKRTPGVVVRPLAPALSVARALARDQKALINLAYNDVSDKARQSIAAMPQSARSQCRALFGARFNRRDAPTGGGESFELRLPRRRGLGPLSTRLSRTRDSPPRQEKRSGVLALALD